MTPTTQVQNLQQMAVTPVRTYKAQAYGAIVVMIAVPVLCIAGNQAGLLRVVFPVLSFVDRKSVV